MWYHHVFLFVESMWDIVGILYQYIYIYTNLSNLIIYVEQHQCHMPLFFHDSIIWAQGSVPATFHHPNPMASSQVLTIDAYSLVHKTTGESILMIHFNDGSIKGPLDFDIFFVCMPKVIFIASMEVSMLPKWCRLRYPTPPVHPDGPRTKWTHIDDQQVPCREYLPPVGETEPTMPGGGPCELIEASRLARLLKEASPLEGLQLAHRWFC